MALKGALHTLLRVFDEFRQLHSEIQTDTINIFLLISTNPGITSRELMQQTGMSQSAVSRHLAVLSEWSWKGGNGLDLVENIEDPTDRRTKRSYLKHKGRSFAMKLVQIMNPSEEPDLADFPLAKDAIRNLRGGGAR